jgi:hypothetical protein
MGIDILQGLAILDEGSANSSLKPGETLRLRCTQWRTAFRQGKVQLAGCWLMSYQLTRQGSLAQVFISNRHRRGGH